jgi:hypothetical protein
MELIVGETAYFSNIKGQKHVLIFRFYDGKQEAPVHS